jgi:hypothetical protein
MGEVNTADARAQFSEIINRAAFAKERVTRIEGKNRCPKAGETILDAATVCQTQ